ncbi:aminotransferase class V-fold PLP-dependent enzyme [Streptomyces sp. NBC_01221]|uniref:aminotransferase class V-fold PLP-dependent enzyme n=1 Tax=unclassified Streptomyces TaxID=2593676 RepID=UPI002251C66D|nr:MULTISPECIES: aminotransferase class V-fold PLP-dependent enzyme [unclassified Streptomyces]MCX4785907.1 aminotransferase class V-fold PLP-dependent enzyme [Streptomyces sp. NBC_01221]WSJ39479.1 aminotransferase class V-fold PLP-dependent enzyme [Streptomyces sp. NBC_01321]WSP54381.1 aminotransferase class V-fold PLP-dependent enzyme [Streptomyces sp. NBC_01241]WSU24944.1 aminotransferase class V-fold PLP-dependent enzyme [Streptomyces sp. NBC_01108]
METTSLSRTADDEFAPETTYLNTSTCGLLPRRTVAAVQALAEAIATGRSAGSGDFEAVEAARAGFARLAGVDADRVATGSSVSVHVGLIAASLPPGAEVLAPEGEFSSVVSPFAVRGDLKVRYVPLDGLADAVRPGTALVAFSAVQSADGRIADLDAVRAAAAAHGARTLLDATQSAGWLPLDAGAYDYTVTGGFKFLLCPRGASFLTVTEEAQRTLPAVFAAWVASDDPWNSTYGPVERLSPTARRYDEPPAFLSYHGAEHSLALLGEVGIDALHAHATGLAARMRAGLAGLGHEAVPGESAIVVVPGLGGREPGLARAGVMVSNRAGNLRAAFHLYNTEADVDRVLDALSG